MHPEFDASWNPSEHCEGVPEFALLDCYLKSGARPIARDSPQWIEDSISKTLHANPQARDAIWKSVLVLWSLAMIRAKTDDMELWKKHLHAWLVSHQYVCL